MVIPRLPKEAAAPARPVADASVRERSYRLLQQGLFIAGAVLMPLGLLVIGLGWYGVAHTPFLYNQMSYLVSGGLLGLGLTFVGGFLYFGAWLAKIAADQRESQRRMADTLLVLADVVSRLDGARSDVAGADAGAVPVRVGDGTTIHRRDCALIAHRSDLSVLSGTEAGMTACRLCKPTVGGLA